MPLKQLQFHGLASVPSEPCLECELQPDELVVGRLLAPLLSARSRIGGLTAGDSWLDLKPPGWVCSVLVRLLHVGKIPSQTEARAV